MPEDSPSETVALRALLPETSDTHLLAEMLGFVADRLLWPAGTAAVRSRIFGRCTSSAPIPVRMPRSGP